jgi:ribosome-binding protein aMBF1 (putative translation factor)
LDSSRTTKLLGWSLEELAHKVRLSVDIARLESGKPSLSFIGTAMIQRALEIAAVEFVEENGDASQA